METPTSPPLSLPVACDPCRKRKRKCDKRSPVCGGCQRLNIDCCLPLLDGESVGAVTANAKAQRTPKAYIERLEAQAQALRDGVASKRYELEAIWNVNGPPMHARANRTAPSGRVDPAVHFVGEEHAMGFVKLILGTIRNEAMKSLYVSKDDQVRQNHTNIQGEDIAAAGEIFPLDINLGQCLMHTYLRRGHPRHPFLAYSTIVSVCERVLQAETSQEPASDGDIFRAYAILAIGAAYRNQELHAQPGQLSESSSDPARLFSVAMGRASKVNLLSGLEGIQNLLLISRYGFFCLTGASLWEISSLCIHMCIDNELHRSPRRPVDAFEEQMQRRVFWQCYNLNRHCATTLGLPFGISDAQITVGPIVDIEDDSLHRARESLEILAASLPRERTSMSLMIWQTHLRRTCSKMREEFKNLKRSRRYDGDLFHECVATATVWDIHINYAEQLSLWRSQYPVQSESSTQNELYFNTGWRDLHYFQEKLLLVRCSMEHSSTQLGGPGDPLDLTEELYESASAVVRLYSQLLENDSIEPTIGRLYRLLTAGLSALYTVVTEIQNAKRDTKQSHSKIWWEERLALLKLCRDTLESMSTQFMNGQMTLKYVKYFDVLCREVLKNLVEPSLWQKRNHDPTSATARNDVSTSKEPLALSQHATGNDELGMPILNSLSATTSSGTTVPAHAFVASPSYVSPDAQSLSSPFAWLNDPNSNLDFVELTCRSTYSHLQPCYCGLVSNLPMPLAPELVMGSDGNLANLSAQNLDLPWLNASTAVDNLPLGDWGDIFMGYDRFPDM